MQFEEDLLRIKNITSRHKLVRLETADA